MSHGIAIVGANGSGKTTLGKHLAELLLYKHMDIEDYYFIDSANPYANPRTREEMRELLSADIKKHGKFILSAVNGDFGDDINAMYDCVIYIKVPLEIRLDRVKQRSADRFGSRVFEGGDMYKQEQVFLNFIALRTMDKTDAWLQSVKCPVFYVDGTQPIAGNVKVIKENITKLIHS